MANFSSKLSLQSSIAAQRGRPSGTKSQNISSLWEAAQSLRELPLLPDDSQTSQTAEPSLICRPSPVEPFHDSTLNACRGSLLQQPHTGRKSLT
jgi:hypothetical protein